MMIFGWSCRALWVAALLVVGSTSATAQDWRIYDRPFSSHVRELDAQSVRSENGKIFFVYRERWLNPSIPGMEYPIRGVVDCAAKQRADVDRDGSFTMRDLYPGTAQARQFELACQLAAGPPTGQPVQLVENSVIRLVDPPSQPRIYDFNTGARRAPLKVAFVYVGPIGDGGWTFSHDRARQAVERQLGARVQVTWVEKVPEGMAAMSVIQDLIAQGHMLIFATAFGYMEPVLKAAEAHPRVRFEHATGYKTAHNVRAYDIRGDEGAYLAGIVAGRMSRSNVLGVVASIPIPDVVRNINAYTQGARSVNPRIRTRVAWVGEWFNPAKEAEAARALLEGGADILLQNTDSSQVVATAQRMGKRAIGWVSDMHPYGPRAHLGSVVLNWGPYYVKAVRDAIDGSWTSDRVKWGVAHEAVTIASLASDVPVDVRDKIRDVTAAITEGRFSIWQGPISNNEGRMMVEAGSIIDDERQESMYFYVEGVEGRLPAPK